MEWFADVQSWCRWSRLIYCDKVIHPHPSFLSKDQEIRKISSYLIIQSWTFSLSVAVVYMFVTSAENDHSAAYTCRNLIDFGLKNLIISRGCLLPGDRGLDINTTGPSLSSLWENNYKVIEIIWKLAKKWNVFLMSFQVPI